MSDDAIERLSTVFAEFMTPNEAGEPLLLEKDAKLALQELGVPEKLVERLLPKLDPDQLGEITFERFCEVIHDNISDMSVSRDDVDDGGSSDSEEMGGGFFDDEFNDDSDESYVAEEDASRENRSGETTELDAEQSSTCTHVFDQLKGSGGRITLESLIQVAQKLKFNVTEQEMARMLEMASTKQEFERLWAFLK